MSPLAWQQRVPTAPNGLCNMLAVSKGAVQLPIRAELFGAQRFAEHGRSLGQTHRAGAAVLGTATFFPRLQSNIRVLRSAFGYIGAQSAAGYDISPAGEWLLDNFHLVEDQLKEVHEGLPRRYFLTLPVLLDRPLAGLPRIYGVAWAFVAHTDSAFDEDLLVQFLIAYQESRALNLGELWALPTTLRVVLIENLRRLAERVAANSAALELANLCCDRIESYRIGDLTEMAELLGKRGVLGVFLVQCAERALDNAAVAGARFSDAQQLWLSRALPDPGAARARQNAEDAADNLSVSNALISLRAIADADWPGIVARTSGLMRIMLASSVFEAEDTLSRDDTLHGIERLARRGALSELVVAQTLLGLMQASETPGAPPAVATDWLYGPGSAALVGALGLSKGLKWRSLVDAWPHGGPMTLPLYLGTLAIGTAFLLIAALTHPAIVPSEAASSPWVHALGALLMVFPLSEAVIAVVNRLVSESVRPRHLPRLALATGIPADHRVMVAIPCMLGDDAVITALARRLQLHFLANPDPQAQFALLTDWADADGECMPSDQQQLDAATRAIAQLNVEHPVGSEAKADSLAPRFILLHRARQFSQTEQRWIGWERKRGKLEQLAAALSTGTAGAFVNLDRQSQIAAGTTLVLTLDSDTVLPPDQLRALVGVALHPHNRPRLSADGRSVVAGYGILQPRIVTPLPAPHENTPYHWLFAGQCGIGPYSAASSEVYQDLFRAGSFIGKGLLDVRAVHAVLAGALPECQILSHDLIEGALASCATVSDVTLIEDAPSHADVAASRMHRWTRGDWQLLPLLLSPLRPRLGALNCWKLSDNLRRSLVAPMSIGLLLLALSGHFITPLGALAIVFAAFAAGTLLGSLASFFTGCDDLAHRRHYAQSFTELARSLAGALWNIAQLLQLALMACDAIIRTLWRMMVSHRRLMQWTTAAAAKSAAQNDLAALVRNHLGAAFAALGLLGGLVAVGTPEPLLSCALCAMWAASPLWTWWVSAPRTWQNDPVLADADADWLRGVARDSWRYFERCVTELDNHLPPDNLQIAPIEALAHRTSPTNIGLYLLAVACARQFGWIGTQTMLDRLEATARTLARLPRHRGHFLNWYDTTSCLPLQPLYVSAVDSGNLTGQLLAVAAACRERAATPYDGAAIQSALAQSVARIRPLLALPVRRLAINRKALRALLADHRAARDSALRDQKAASAAQAPANATRRLLEVANGFEQLAWEAEFGFLYHPRRRLFHIGYRVAEQRLDTGFYDLLASEARLTSLLAIAKGDVPVRHWAALGRPYFAVGSRAGLRSWSGSMFEYLMPGLVLDEPDGSALHDACLVAFDEQQRYARLRAVPWGISESAYAGRDHTLAYQYAPHGVPRLALRRTPPDEMVIAPYATALAAQIAPQQARLNLGVLEGLGGRGRYGFIEALDFSAVRQSGTHCCTLVETFMAHHQAMTIAALTNLLQDRACTRWGMANPRVAAVSSLMQERAPGDVSRLPALAQSALHPAIERQPPRLQRTVTPGASAIEPTQLLSNGMYSVALRANGAGWSNFGQVGITRSRDDALRDADGSFFYLRWAKRPALVSITQHPAADPEARYQCTFHPDRVCFDALWEGVQAHTTVWVSREDDIEFRQIDIHNHSDETMEIELLSAFEVTLCDPRADEAHPAFSGMFVQAHWRAEDQALVFERRPRLDSEPGLHLAHFLTETDAQVVSIRGQTDRARWLGRNQGAARPQASLTALSETAGTAPQLLDTGLDPVCVIAVGMRIAPRQTARLTFATASSVNRGVLHAIVDKYRQTSHVQRAAVMSSTLTGIELRGMNLTVENFAAIQILTTAMVMYLARSRPDAVSSDSGPRACDRRRLWRLGISGDRPLLLVNASSPQSLGMLRSLAQALRRWAWSGIACDLVVVNGEPLSYQMGLQREIEALREPHWAEGDTRTRDVGAAAIGFHLLRADTLDAEDLYTLRALARVRLHADGRPLAYHVDLWAAAHDKERERRRARPATVVLTTHTMNVPVIAPVGVFGAHDGTFMFDAGADMRPSRPWINVLANHQFGTQVSEAGAGFTWAVNSCLNQLTAWSNDPVADPPSEWFLLQDIRSGDTWSVSPCAWGDERLRYRVSHGQGMSTIAHRRGDLETLVTWCVDLKTSVKQVHIDLINHGSRTLHIRVVAVAEWMMGERRVSRATVHTAKMQHHNEDGEVTVLLATQRECASGFGNGTAFFAVSQPASANELSVDWTCDRRECFDAHGQLLLPTYFGERCGEDLDPCAVLAVPLRLVPGARAGRQFLLGYASDPEAARALAVAAVGVPAARRIDEVQAMWNQLLGTVSVQTPDPLFDAMVNRWLMYQTVSCRLWAKAAFYQAGGATGYRDQLQDAMALGWAAPGMLRDQIVLCASRQFPEGDVQHWWHAPTGAGVRTHVSDDLLWLPHACARYIELTDELALLDEAVPFIEGMAVAGGAEDAYYIPTVSVVSASIYEHAARAIDRSLCVGAHGLPLIGTGDWNDSMNRVGHLGRGESVWLGWFLCDLVPRFAPFARARGEAARAQGWEAAVLGWKAALLGPAWDGGWFKRAFFDDGQALGSHLNGEGRIDLIAQAWSVISDAAPLERQRAAMAAVEAMLVDPAAGLVRLLDPPFAHSVPSAGYIQAYPAGVRENGGQYSHAAVWALIAQARIAQADLSVDVAARADVPRADTPSDSEHALAASADVDAAARSGAQNGVGLARRDSVYTQPASADGDIAYRYFTYLSPAHRAADSRYGAQYGIEPYVMAGDVYSQPPYTGRGGWSWYTGAAGWMHRAAIETLFGLHMDAHSLSFAPCLPTHWARAELTLRRDTRSMRFILVRAGQSATLRQTAQWSARLLQPGAVLPWTALESETCFAIPLLAGP